VRSSNWSGIIWRRRFQRLAIVSPITGVITTPKLKERIGEHVPHGALITKVHQLKTIKAQIAIPEKEIADARLGQPVVLKARAVPAETFSGRVISVSPTATRADDALWSADSLRHHGDRQ
jgi:multidrug resistance efflux pump